ncbi:hypothetical protein GCK32_019638, partial [Trichostrongylus colubriformis]
VNAFVSVGDFSSVLLQSLVYIVSAAVIVYLLFVYLASDVFSGGEEGSSILKRASNMRLTLPIVPIVIWCSRLPYIMGADAMLRFFDFLM